MTDGARHARRPRHVRDFLAQVVRTVGRRLGFAGGFGVVGVLHVCRHSVWHLYLAYQQIYSILVGWENDYTLLLTCWNTRCC